MKNLLKIKSIKNKMSIAIQAIFAISNAVEENFIKMVKVAERRGVDFIKVNDNKTEIKINNTILTPTGLVVMVDETKVEDDKYIISVFRNTLNDVFKLKSPTSKYFSINFREVLGKMFN